MTADASTMGATAQCLAEGKPEPIITSDYLVYAIVQQCIRDQYPEPEAVRALTGHGVDLAKAEAIAREAYQATPVPDPPTWVQEVLDDMQRVDPPAVVAADSRLDELARARAKREKAKPGAIVQRASSITPERVSWIWPGWLPCKFAVMAGSPGCGKSTLTVLFAAHVSRGRPWPDGQRGTAGRVLIWSGEDGVADTLVPRLTAAGADLAMIDIITGARDSSGKARPFNPAEDLEGLREHMAGVRLVVVDPVVSTVRAGSDSHKTVDVRRDLQPLVDLAEEFGCCVLGVSHFAKSSKDRDPIDRIVGSGAFAALPRVVLLASKHRDGGRLLVRAKSNIGPDTGGWRYGVEATDDDPFSVRVAVLNELVEGEARDLLRDAEGEAEDGGTNACQGRNILLREEATRWLREILKDGPRASKEVDELAAQEGFKSRTMIAARKIAGIVSRRVGGAWTMELPPEPPKGTPRKRSTAFDWLTGDDDLEAPAPAAPAAGWVDID